MVRVLLAEDDRDTHEAVRQALGDEGYEVTSAYDGQAALDALGAATTPMVVLLDLYLGLVGGATVLRTVAANAHLTARNRYIVVTAVPSNSVDVPHDLLAQLAIPFIAKPFDLAELLAEVKRAADSLPLA
jgi:DNA-binding response OmpR family regulator